ncbi:MAG: hypothetical protein LBN24_10470 [Mediterranea sp.]|jgi:hypothetical protein|nr:hypothetical protein [Mediterranea sp.]
MEYLKMFAYTDEQYTQQHGDKLTLLLNPASIKLDKAIAYLEDKRLGTTNGTNLFESYKPETLSFDFCVDCTGAVEGTAEGDTAYKKVKELEERLYVYNSEAHRPSFVVISYGELLFKGQLTSMDVSYTLFNAQGVPYRAKVAVKFSGYRGSDEERKKYSKLSPDMSRQVVLKEGETLAAICQQVYGDSLLVRQVAHFNGLSGFRNLPPGTELLIPPLKK